jgi:hypothetical protein
MEDRAMTHGSLVTTTTIRKSGPQPVAHIAVAEVNGNIQTRCGLSLKPGKRQPAPEDREPCGKCASHLAETPDRKRFTRAAYKTDADLRRF